MGKKVKAITLGVESQGSLSNTVVLEDLSAMQSVAGKIATQMVDSVSMKSKILDADTQKKLDDYDNTIAQNAMLLLEKADLESKIASYIEEIRTLKAATQSKDNAGEHELDAAESEIANLKNSVAQYLRRISDLTFENATLNAQLKELSTKSAQVQNTIPAMPTHETYLEKPVYNPYKHNGYASWN